MATFCLIIDGFLAFNLDVIELNDGFYETLKGNPKVIICSDLEVSTGDEYVEDTFYRDGIPVASIDPSIGFTKFAFVVDGVVSLIQEISDDNEMLVAAYSSDPLFAEIPADE